MRDEHNISYLTIGEITQLIKCQLEQEPRLQNVTVRGEVAQIASRGGHYYITLKDEQGFQLRVVLFRSYVYQIEKIPQMGDDVLVYGSITVYGANGQYQLLARDILLAGLGAQLIALQKLKEKLQKEGLFDEGHKKRIPRFPRKIGIITALHGAAIQDIVKNIVHRFPLTDFTIFPAGVQGERAVSELLSSLKKASNSDCDVLIIGRGGGGKEDLMAFNDETLVREVYACPIPIISAVGHEIDRSLVDFVADLAVSTPTEAAVRATPDQNEILQNFDDHLSRMEHCLQRILFRYQDSLRLLKQNLRSPKEKIDRRKEILGLYQNRLQKSFSYQVEHTKEGVDYAWKLLQQNLFHYLKNLKVTLEHQKALLEKSNPTHWLEKGFAITTDANGKMITKASDVAKGDHILLQYQDGTVEATVERTVHGKEKDI